jgi:hypothetical protein
MIECALLQERPMPRGPKGERRPTDVISAAVMVAKIATGEIEDTKGKSPGRSKGGRAGGAARAKALSPDQRRRIAKAGASSRWSIKRTRPD